ncbi:MAG TPA: M20/M25/M40 family metallo-hydrolase [Gemmatimonadales bacterium]|nr:M20/M25/M40 family metallo-hydrolase [Gemmatimonadales bacterium]
MSRHRMLTIAALATLAGVAPLHAQSFPTDDPVIKHIYAIGMDSTDLYRQAHVLFDSVGPRLMGTPNLSRAQDWLVDTYKAFGIDAKKERFGTWRGWERGPSHIDLVSPRIRSLEGQMVGYSPGTNGKPATLPVVILPRFADSTAFVAWLPKAKGKLVMISAPMPTCRAQSQYTALGTPEEAAEMAKAVTESKAEWASARARDGEGASAGVRGTGYSAALGGGELGVRLEQGGAAGIITSRPKLTWSTGGGAGGRGGFGGGGAGSQGGVSAMEIFETYNTRTPAIALNCEDYGLVFRLAEAGDAPTLRLDLDARLLGEQPVFNVVATIPGTEKPNEYVVLSAHYDSWDGSSGATDNGTGTLTMLEAMRILKQVYPHPKRTIIAGHWSGEEEGEVGSKAFTEDHPEVIAGLQTVFNQDNGTGPIRSIGGGGMVGSPEHVNRWLSAIPTEWRDSLRTSLPGGPSGSGSDGYAFTCYGVPTTDLGSSSWDYFSLTWHTERDTYDKVVFPALKYNATLTAMLAYEASEDPTMIPHQKVDLASAGGRTRTWPTCEKAPRSTNPRLK